MDSASNDRGLKWLALPAAEKHQGSGSENNRTRMMFLFGFTAGVAFAFGATAYAYRLIQQIPGNTTES